MGIIEKDVMYFRETISSSFQPIFSAWSKTFFVVFCLVLFLSYFFFSPGWGFMDDLGNRMLAAHFWKGDLSFSTLMSHEIRELGRFRPVYYIWIILVYAISSPLIIYLLILSLGLWAIYLWGPMLVRLFPHFPEPFLRYVMPLSFFCFLPFWNNFMYLSVQEKFIFLFGTVSLLFLWKAYDKSSFSMLVVSVGFAVLGLFSKETGIALLAAYAIYALLDVLISRGHQKVSIMLLVISTVVGLCYAVFIMKIFGSYSDPYKTGLSLPILWGRVVSAPLAIKASCVVALCSMAITAVEIFRERPERLPMVFICSLWTLIFFLLLLPWGFSTYLLAPAGPFVMVCLLHVFDALIGSRRKFMTLLMVSIIAGIVLILVGIIIPRISKMADKRKVIDAVVALNTPASARFFYPPPFAETALSIEGFSSASVTLTGNITGEDLSAGQKNFLIVNDEAGQVILSDVSMGHEEYRNGTWSIFALEAKSGSVENVVFFRQENPLQKIKRFLMRS